MRSQRWTLDGQRALVTGASAGIGLAICRELLGLGAQVLMVARDADALEQARADLEEEFPGPEDACFDNNGCAPRQSSNAANRLTSKMPRHWSSP